MRPTASAALLALFLTAAPSPAAAAPFSTWSFFVTGGELDATFGLVPFQISAPLIDDLVPVDWFAFGSGSFDLVSGPLTDLTVDGLGTHYSYGPGAVTITLSGSDKNGNPVAGTLTAPTLPFSFTVCEGCDHLFGGGLVFGPVISFGPGLLDPAFASALHLSRDAFVDSLELGLEAVDGDPSSTVRTGFDHRGFATLEVVVEAPEPSLLILGALSATALALRRGRRRA